MKEYLHRFKAYKFLVVGFDTIILLTIFPIIKIYHLITPFKLVNIVDDNRIGNLATAEIYIRKLIRGEHQQRCKYIFIANSKRCANQQLLKMFKRAIVVIDNFLLHWFISHFKFWLIKLRFSDGEMQPGNGRTEYKEFRDMKSILSFTQDEIEEGVKYLFKNTGFKVGHDRAVAIFARDAKHLETLYGENAGGHHRQRNVDIDNYKLAINYLIQNGYWVFRIGSAPGKKVSYSHERFIDYGFTEWRSDFMDIFLFHIIEFLIGTPSGICEVANAMDTPYLGVDYYPGAFIPPGKNSLYIPKKLRDIVTKEVKPFYEVWKTCDWKDSNARFNNNTIYFTDLFNQTYQLEYVDNEPQDVLKATQEMVARVNGTWNPVKEDIQILDRYYSEALPINTHFSHILTPICTAWLKDNKHLYFPNI